MAEVDEKLAQGPGTLLADARKEAGLTQEEVADKLHLSAGIVRKLETDDYDDQLPDAFARGYLRNYAKLLDLDQQEVIAQYSQFIGSTMVKNYYEPSTEIGSPQRGMQTINQIMIWIVLAVIVVIVAIWFMSRDNGNETISTATDTPQISDTMDQVQPDLGQSVQPETETISVEQQAITEDSPDETDEVLEAEVSPIPTGFVETPEAMLTFEFLGDVWVQVTDSNAEVLAVGLKTQGRRFQVSGMAPISVVLGKPREVYLAYNGEEVDLSCFPAGSTARFSLDGPQVCDL
jgi:cytoskeleton protein RodZ